MNLEEFEADRAQRKPDIYDPMGDWVKVFVAAIFLSLTIVYFSSDMSTLNYGLITLLVACSSTISFYWWKYVSFQLTFPRREAERKGIWFIAWLYQIGIIVEAVVGAFLILR